MKKQIFCFITALILFSQLFCHEAQKQTSQIKADAITIKWEECKKVWGTEKQLPYLKDFYHTIEEAVPNATIIYYFPETKTIYERIKQSVGELIRISPTETTDS